MTETKWSTSEKKIARRAFEGALERELAYAMAEFKARAAAAKTPADMWEVEHHLTRTRREIDRKYDYRYSQLEIVFGVLLRGKRIDLKDLEGLAEDKLDRIRLVASL